MSFTIRLSQDLTAVEAGATVPLSIEVTNKGEEEDRFEMQVEGLDPEWTASPEPVFTVGSHEIHSQKVFFKPPRASESLSGNYPFVVKVRSLNSGDSRTAQGVLQVKAFNHLSMEISPKKGYSTPLRRQNAFSLTVMNLGNTEHTLQLSGADPEEECTYEFASDQITIGPGQQRDVQVTVAVAAGSIISTSKLFGFAITARSLQSPNVIATTQGQLERRPLLSPGTLLAGVIVVALFALWFAERPQPPTMSVSVDSSNVFQGQSVQFHWRAQHANTVRLEIRRSVNGKVQAPEVQSDLQTEGTREIQTTNEDAVTVSATAIGDNGKDFKATPVTINVQVPPPAPKPKILSFEASKHNVKLGEPVLLTFSYSPDVVKLVLSPTNQQILPPSQKIEITPTQTGPIEYELFAYNKDNGVVSAKVTVDAEQVSDATIIDFSADPPVVQGPEGQTTVSWNVTNAAQVQLDDGSGNPAKVVDAVGSIPYVTDKPMTLKLIATDAKGITTRKILNIKFKPQEAPPNITPPSSGGDANPPVATGSTGGR